MYKSVYIYIYIYIHTDMYVCMYVCGIVYVSLSQRVSLARSFPVLVHSRACSCVSE